MIMHHGAAHWCHAAHVKRAPQFYLFWFRYGGEDGSGILGPALPYS